MKGLFDKGKFYSLLDLENANDLDVKGLYALRLKSGSLLSKLTRNNSVSKDAILIYIGKGERTIRKRLLEECRGKGHGTFFRGIGALQGFLPPKGSLVTKKNKSNYKFSKDDTEKIVCWMNENLEFSFVALSENIDEIERKLIRAYKPILNNKHNPQKLEELADLREKCRKHALTQSEGKVH